MNVENLILKRDDETIIGQRFNSWTIISPHIYYNVYNNTNYVMCKCDCGNTEYVSFKDMKSNKSKHCLHCYDNKYIIINDFVSILLIYDFKTNSWIDTYVNTNCIDFLKSIGGNWYIKYSNTTVGRKEIICHIPKTNKLVYLSRVIVEYINELYNIKESSRCFYVDHINGDTLNNLYYPNFVYYNNLRKCTSRQNNLNTECAGYTKLNEISTTKYISQIYDSSGKNQRKIHLTKEECIKFNISLLNDEDKAFYYHSKTNPRNWEFTFGNSILTDDTFYDDNDFIHDDFIEIFNNLR